MNRTYLTIGIVAALIVGMAFVGYRASAQNSTADSPLTSSAMDSSDPGKDILFLLNQLSVIRIDKEIFSNAVFLSLKDFGLKVVEEPYGRPNPFAPIGDDSASVSSSQSTTVSGSPSGSAASKTVNQIPDSDL